MSVIDNKTANVAFDGTIGDDWWDTSAKSAAMFRDELKELGDVETINVSINSPGGSVFDGISIYNMLKNHKATINVSVEGLAASIASVIAMAGDTLTMNTGSMLMIHNPWTFTQGNANELRDTADLLDKLGGNAIDIYSKRTGIDDATIQSIMDAETWLTADEAVDQGWADSINEQPAVAASIDKSIVKTWQNMPDKFTAEVEAEEIVPEETPINKYDEAFRKGLQDRIADIEFNQKEIKKYGNTI
jgi:ATP-dependent Clp protease protease subunit